MSELKSRAGEDNPDSGSPKLFIKFACILCVTVRSFPKSMEEKKTKTKQQRKILSRIPVCFGARSVLSEQY